MRTIKRTCFPLLLMLWLTSCGGPAEKGPAKVETPLRPSDDSSPIIIADGSIHVRHKKGENHFVPSSEADQSVTIMTQNYFPVTLGFLCDPTPAGILPACPAKTNCTATAAPISAACTVPLPNAPWTLDLCQLGAATCSAAPDVVIAGNASSNTMSVTTTNGNFLYNPPHGNTGELVYSAQRGSDHMGSPVLTYNDGTVKTYTFTCPTNGPCLIFNYQCTTANGC